MGPDVLPKSLKLCIQLLLLISSLQGTVLNSPPRFGVTKKAPISLLVIRKKGWTLGDHLSL